MGDFMLSCGDPTKVVQITVPGMEEKNHGFTKILLKPLQIVQQKVYTLRTGVQSEIAFTEIRVNKLMTTPVLHCIKTS